MAISLQKASFKSGARSTTDYEFRIPNPGDVFLLVAFAWAAVCFLLVTGGGRLARQAARLTGSTYVRDLILTEQSAIGLVMVVGILGLGAAFYLFNRYQVATAGLFLFSMSFASAQWIPLHDFSFAFKYLLIAYFGSYGALFFIKNGWKLTETKGYRLVLMYVGWFGIAALINGMKIGDLWYAVTEFVLMIGFGIAWFGLIKDDKRLEQVNLVIAYVAIAVTITHFISPLVMKNFTAEGRFVSYFSRATGFANTYAVFVVALFWLSMSERRETMQRVYAAIAFAGYALILWSGSRSAAVATLVGVGAIWWVLRSRILEYAAYAAILGLIGQLIFSGDEEIARLSSRIASTENTRIDIWTLYWEVWLTNPLLGYGFDGLSRAVYGATLADTLGSYVRLTVPQVHNHYLGLAVRFGFIGFSLCLAMFYFSLRCAWRVVNSTAVSLQSKKQYILHVALMLVIMLEGLFEDMMGSTGKGTVHGIIMGMTVPLVYVYGQRLLDQASQNKRDVQPVRKQAVGGQPVAE